MNVDRFNAITSRYGRLQVVVAGDFCLDRYLHLDPSLEEVSLETHLPAHQVVQVRPQPGGAGNVLANVAALGPASLSAVGVCGRDGEGYELLRALKALGADLGDFIRTARRKTFTYIKPLVIRPGGRLEELSRLDIKDHTDMPAALVRQISRRLRAAIPAADVVILMEQAAEPAHGVLSAPVKAMLADMAGRGELAGKTILADSRRDITGFAGVDIKVNRDELARVAGAGHRATQRYREKKRASSLCLSVSRAASLARRLGRRVFVTLGGEGMLGVEPDGKVQRVSGIAVAGPTDVVGAGDTGLAHLALALAAGASMGEAIELANAAGSVVVRKLGTTGTATIAELRRLLEKG